MMQLECEEVGDRREIACRLRSAHLPLAFHVELRSRLRCIFSLEKANARFVGFGSGLFFFGILPPPLRLLII